MRFLQPNNYGLPLLCAPPWMSALQYNLRYTFSSKGLFLIFTQAHSISATRDDGSDKSFPTKRIGP